jgi:hypothetical protein
MAGLCSTDLGLSEKSWRLGEGNSTLDSPGAGAPLAQLEAVAGCQPGAQAVDQSAHTWPSMWSGFSQHGTDFHK